MSVYKPVTEQRTYSITFTNHEWLPLIELTKGYSLYAQFRFITLAVIPGGDSSGKEMKA